MNQERFQSVVVIVAHPDDETLWAGGTLLSNPSWKCFVVCLCRGNDRDRAPKFHKALTAFGAEGIMGDLDDGPDQLPLKERQVKSAILDLLPSNRFDLTITHSPLGEYTRHLRHEEIGKAVIDLWNEDALRTKQLWNFAYEDGDRAYLPKPIRENTLFKILPTLIWQKKYGIITNIYGFDECSWEARTTPRAESFWQFHRAKDAKNLLHRGAAGT